LSIIPEKLRMFARRFHFKIF